MNINCIIVEDEPLAEEKLRRYILKVPYLKLLSSFDNAIEALAFLKREQVDLVLLDIEMDELSGIELLESLHKRPEIIFTTAHDRHALKAFELKATDYLLKPFSFARFTQAVSRVYDLLSHAPVEEQKYIFIKTEYRLEKISLDDILFIEGMRDYRKLHLVKKSLMTLQTFGELEQQLPAHRFCRIHKSYLVSLEKVESIERERIRINNVLIPLSVTYKEQFFRLIGLKS